MKDSSPGLMVEKVEEVGVASKVWCASTTALALTGEKKTEKKPQDHICTEILNQLTLCPFTSLLV